MSHHFRMRLRIAELLEKRGMTQAALADQADLSRGFMSHIVAGKKLPSPAAMARIAAILEVSPGDLFEREGPGPTGMAESGVEPFEPPRRMADLLAVIAPSARHPATMRARVAAPGFAISAGDIIVVDLSGAARPGDLVVATIDPEETGDAQTSLYRFARPWLIPGDTSAPPIAMDNSGVVVRISPIRAVLRRSD